MDDYQEELLECHEQDEPVELAEDATEL